MRISDWSSDVCSSDLPVFGQISPLKRPFGAVSSHGSLKEILATPCAQASVRRGNRNRLRPCMPVRFISSQSSLSRTQAMHSSVRVGLFGAACSKRSEEHTSELQSLMRISYAVFCLKKKNKKNP